MLYDKVGDAGAMADERERERWQEFAAAEVESAVKKAKTCAAEPAA